MEIKDSKELNRILSLMESINGFKSSKMLTETRKVASPKDVFDIMDKIGNNKFVSIGYVMGANLQLPQVRRRNPKTNYMKNYDDYETFGKEIGHDGEIGAIIQITSYNLRYNKSSMINQLYSKYKSDANNIYAQYGLPPIGDKENGYTTTMNYGEGVKSYDGKNQELVGHTYSPQNTFGANINSKYYIVDGQGNITKELTKEQIKNYLKPSRPMRGVPELIKRGTDPEIIENFKNAINGLKFKYKAFENNSILYIAATVEGEKIIYINDNLTRCVNGINVNKEDFINVAKERYQKDLETVEKISSEQKNEQSI